MATNDSVGRPLDIDSDELSGVVAARQALASRTFAACRRALARLPHHAIEHHRRRPVGLRNNQPQMSLGHAPTVAAAGVVRNPAAAQATLRSGRSSPDPVTRQTAGVPAANSTLDPAGPISRLTPAQSAAEAGPTSTA